MRLLRTLRGRILGAYVDLARGRKEWGEPRRKGFGG
jgi:hypothetical protein